MHAFFLQCVVPINPSDSARVRHSRSRQSESVRGKQHVAHGLGSQQRHRLHILGGVSSEPLELRGLQEGLHVAATEGVEVHGATALRLNHGGDLLGLSLFHLQRA